MVLSASPIMTVGRMHKTTACICCVGSMKQVDWKRKCFRNVSYPAIMPCSPPQYSADRKPLALCKHAIWCCIMKHCLD